MTDSDLIAARLHPDAKVPLGYVLEYFRGHLAQTCQDGVSDKCLNFDAPAARKIRRAAQDAKAAGRVTLTQRRCESGFSYTATGTGK
jgi:hypothetical protein